MERQFVDEARILVVAGEGGDGCSSFLRQKHQPKGRPDGGNGGDGGSVILRVEANVATLADLARNPHQRATGGKNGSGSDKHGAGGADRVVLVPDGTVVRGENGELLADLVGEGVEFVAARGGRGGRGNAALATARRRAPGFAERGEPGEERWISLELKVLADVGLVGFPNAGKSSLIARLSAARPKVADYPFTTLTPNLGVAVTGDARFVIADVPGLIEGASEGRGLGLAFLRHLERCRALCFVIDVASGEDPAEVLDVLRAELRAHDPSFDARPSLVAANKIDLSSDRVEDARTASNAASFQFVACSAVTGAGIDELNDVLGALVARARAEAGPVSHKLIRLRPEETDIVVEREDIAWRVHSERVEKLLERFDVTNAEALRFVQGKLAGWGVETALSRAGAHAGDEVRIGDHAFDFEPDEAAESHR